jgi:hypothetical protein
MHHLDSNGLTGCTGKDEYATMSSVDRTGGLEQVQPGLPAVFRRHDAIMMRR